MTRGGGVNILLKLQLPSSYGFRIDSVLKILNRRIID